jgi:hypothetical protein
MISACIYINQSSIPPLTVTKGIIMISTAAVTTVTIAIAAMATMIDLAKDVGKDYLGLQMSQVAYIKAVANGDEEAAQRHAKASIAACRSIVLVANAAARNTDQSASQMACPDLE